MTPQRLQLVRKGTELKDPHREMRVEITPPNPNKLLPALFTQQKFVVPREDFLNPIDMDGKPLRARMLETDETVDVYPEFRLTGVEEGDGGKRLAVALYHGYDQQIPALRELLDGLFRGFLGHQPTAEDLERIAGREKRDYQELRKRVAVTLGLRVEWSLQPDPKTAEWLRSLVEISPTSTVATYNKELASTEFNLAYSLAVERASMLHLHRLQRRARLNLSPLQEFERIFQRVYEMTNPAFRAVWTGLNVWNRDLVRELAVDGFAKVVADRIMKEMGYLVKFSDFVPQPNQAHIDTIQLVSSRKLLEEDYTNAETVLRDLREKRKETLIDSFGNYEKIKPLEASIELAEADLARVRTKLLAGNQHDLDVLQSTKPAALEDLRQRFRSALLLEDNASGEGRYAPPE